MKTIQKPAEGEYASYTIAYIGLVPADGLVLQHLVDNSKITKDIILAQPEAKLTYRFAEGEWTIKEILVHVMDTERIFNYRALRVARNDTTPLPGFEQDDYVPYSGANNRSIADILDEYTAVRTATLALFNSFDEAALSRAGKVSGNPMSVRAAAYIITGHEMHHINSIKKNYL